MHLRDYLKKTGLSQAAFGQRLVPPVSQGKVNHWLEGRRRVSLAEAIQVHRLTEGQVTVEDLAELGSRAPAVPTEAPAAEVVHG